jgi:hypothetical protein
MIADYTDLAAAIDMCGKLVRRRHGKREPDVPRGFGIPLTLTQRRVGKTVAMTIDKRVKKAITIDFAPVVEVLPQ